jgi:cellulose synthase (UDP-forming)
VKANRRFHWLEFVMLLAALALGVTGFALSADGAEWLAGFVRGWMALAERFRVVNASTPLLTVLMPTVLLGAALYGLMVLNPHPGRPLRAAVILLLAGLYTGYMAFRLFATLNFSDTGSIVFSVLFFLAELIIYLKALSAYLQMFWPKNRSDEATHLSEWVTSGRYLPDVDIFIPTYSEPVEILRRTVLGCQSLRYPRKQIYLLDDQRRPAMRALARELGCHYRDRPDNKHAKAGNMNAALPSTRGELIAVFDADFIPTQDFLERTVGFFMDPKVGLVQTPQNFYSVDAVSRNLGLPDIITEEQQVFMRAAQPGRDSLGAIICHGTSFILRRSALAEVGGFPGETLSEDWATSIKLQSAGYKTCYLNELLSAGVAAEFTSEFATQRLRWARGTLQCFFASTNPLTVPGLTFTQRLVHLCGPIHYLPSVSRLFCLLLPLLYFCFGIVPLNTSGELLITFFLPYWACQALTLSWLAGGHRSAFWSEVYDTMLCFPMTLTILSTFWKPFGKPFKVSAKGETKTGLTFNPVVGTPLLTLLALYVPAVVYAVMNARWAPDPGIFALAIGWSAYSMVLIWVSFLASLDVPQPSSSLRFKHRLPATIRRRGLASALMVEELSDTDLIVTCDPEVLAGPGSLTLSLPVCGLHEAPVSPLRQETPDGFLLKIDRLPVDQHRALIAFLYCRPHQWDERGVPESLTFWHFLQAPFRMYPLAETR